VLRVTYRQSLLGIFILLVHGGAGHAGVNKVFFFLVFVRGRQRHTYYYTKKAGPRPGFLETLLFYLYFLGFVFVFPFKRKPEDPIFQ